MILIVRPGKVTIDVYTQDGDTYMGLNSVHSITWHFWRRATTATKKKNNKKKNSNNKTKKKLTNRSTVHSTSTRRLLKKGSNLEACSGLVSYTNGIIYLGTIKITLKEYLLHVFYAFLYIKWYCCKNCKINSLLVYENIHFTLHVATIKWRRTQMMILILILMVYVAGPT